MVMQAAAAAAGVSNGPMTPPMSDLWVRSAATTLTMTGVPMRSAHEAVGKLVRLCEERRCPLADLPPEAYESVHPGISSEVYKAVGVANALNAFRSAGSTAPGEVKRQIEAWRERLKHHQGTRT